MKTLFRKSRRLGAVLTALAVLLALFPARTAAADTAPTPKVTFTFTDSGIAADSAAAAGFSIDGTVLTINAAGTYGVTGSCAEGSIVVKKDTTGVKLVMTGLTLTCSTSAPLVCKKGSSATLWAEGTSTLTNSEDASAEGTNEDFEGAAIKVKAGGTLVMTGGGTLNLKGSTKNGVKGAGASYDKNGTLEYPGAKIILAGGTVNITAANHGLACDNNVTITGGTLNITAGNDGIKAKAEDSDSAGSINIYGGTINVNAESDGINASGDIAICGGTFDITAQSDGIQTDSNLTISDGTFDIKTLDGYNSGSFNSSTMSCKGLKASCSEEENADSSSADNTITITITGGTFTLNTADDAIHSDAYVEITGGKLSIETGDDGVHADTTLILGTDRGTVARNPDITVNESYEGLEAGTVYIYSGRYYVAASDDGINAAGGSGDGANPGGGPGGGDRFNPGGGFPGGGGHPGGRLMMAGNAQLMADSYSINIAGGSVYVNADGDGLDSNGNLTLTGGKIEVWGQYNRDNEPLDYDGTLTVNGASVFAAGSAGMGQANPSNGSQSYKNFSNSYSAGTVIVVNSGSSVVYSAKAPKNVNYVFFSAPNVSSPTLSTASSVNCRYGSSWAHAWDSGVVTTAVTSAVSGLRTYTCSQCGETETETIPQLADVPNYVDNSDGGGDDTDEGFTVTFATDGHATVNVYYTQNYAAADETNVTSTVSRNSGTGAADSSGDGQVNFTVVPANGYAVDSVTATAGTYNKIKTPDDTGAANTYRITKIKANTTVTITTKAEAEYAIGGAALDRSGGTASATGLLCPADAVLAGIVYDSSSQFLYWAYSTVSAGAVSGSVDFGTVLPDGCTVKLILMDSGYKPLCTPYPL